MGFAYLTKDAALKTTAEVEACLKKIGAEMRDTGENWTLLGLHLKNRDQAMTTENFLKAIDRLRGSLDWAKAPKPKLPKEFQDEGRTGRPNHANPQEEAAFSDPTGVKSLRRAAIDEAKLQHEKKNQEALGRCEGLIRNFQRTPHSRTYQGRDRLVAELARLKSRSSDGTKIEELLIAFEKQIP